MSQASKKFTKEEVKALAAKLQRWAEKELKDKPAERELLEYLLDHAEFFPKIPLETIRIEKSIEKATIACLERFVGSKRRGVHPNWGRATSPSS